MDDFTHYCLTGTHLDLKPWKAVVCDNVAMRHRWVHDRSFCCEKGRLYRGLAEWDRFVKDMKGMLTSDDMVTVKEWLVWQGHGNEDFMQALWFAGDRKRSDSIRRIDDRVDEVVVKVDGIELKSAIDTKMTQYFTHALVPIYKAVQDSEVVDAKLDKKKKKTKKRFTDIKAVNESEFSRDVKAFNEWIKTKPIDKHLLLTMTVDEVERYKDSRRIKL